MFARKRARTSCAHVDMVTVRTAGIERTVCENCGMVSFRPIEGLTGQAARNQFEREAERPHSSVV